LSPEDLGSYRSQSEASLAYLLEEIVCSYSWALPGLDDLGSAQSEVSEAAVQMPVKGLTFLAAYPDEGPVWGEGYEV
jgi:hypothetical protein